MSNAPDDPGAAALSDYSVTRAVQRVAGNLVLPCADGPPVVIETHQPYNVNTVNFSGLGRGRPTTLPRPRDDEQLLSHSVVLPLPTPITGAGGSGWMYSALGEYSTVDTAAATLSTEEYRYPSWPQRLEPQATEMERAGYTYYRDDTPTRTPEVPRPSDPNYVFPQALTISSAAWFSDRLA